MLIVRLFQCIKVCTYSNTALNAIKSKGIKVSKVLNNQIDKQRFCISSQCPPPPPPHFNLFLI